MSATGLSTFDEPVQLSNEWFNELMGAADWDDKYRAYRLPRATLSDMGLHGMVRFHEQPRAGCP